MCGIAGWIDLTGQTVSRERLTRMTDAIRHRGPDDEGIEIFGNVGLGHRRLSILDLSALGHQPMFNLGRSHSLVFNGEIYNYKTLRKEFLENGIRFQSETDTEVILAAYQAHGDKFLSVLDGMFAIALFDEVHHRLTLARDRLGKKPLYYYYEPGKCFAFGSEPKSILIQDEISHHLDAEGVAAYLEFGYVPAPGTPVKNLLALPPGHVMVFNTQTGEIEIPPTAFWDISFDTKNVDESDIEKEFEELMLKSVEKRLQSDVPLGVLLSGGLDSTAITALTRECIGNTEPLHTFSVGFDVLSMDESHKAKAASKVFGTTHHEYICTSESFMEVMGDVLNHVDCPFSEQLVPMYLVSRLAREDVTVVLSGDGADEVLGGYNSYANVHFYQKLISVPGLKQLTNAGGGILLPLLSGWAPNLKRQLSRVHRMSEAPENQMYLAYRYSNTLYQSMDKLFNKDSSLYQEIQECRHPFETFLKDQTTIPEHLDLFEQYLYTDLKTNMAQYILMKSDLMSMAYGLEVRCPFLDADVMSFLFSLPESLKRRRGKSKWILRQYLQSRVPAEIWEQKKSGFSAPFSYWLREQRPFHVFIEKYLLDLYGNCTALGLNEAYLKQLLKEHAQGVSDHGQRIWSLLTFMSWYQNYGSQDALRCKEGIGLGQ